jgi:hypothetical protein
MNKVLEKLFAAANNHGEDDEPDHTVGDLQGLLRRSWELMSVSQRLELLRSEEVKELALDGSRGEFEPVDLIVEVSQAVAYMKETVEANGYMFQECNGYFAWERRSDISEDFYDSKDAIADAYSHFMAPALTPKGTSQSKLEQLITAYGGIPPDWVVVPPDSDRNTEATYLEIHDGFGRTATVYGTLDEENVATATFMVLSQNLMPLLLEAVDIVRSNHLGNARAEALLEALKR